MSSFEEKNDVSESTRIGTIPNYGVPILYRPRAALRAILDTNPRYFFWVIPLIPSLAALPGGLFQASNQLETINRTLELLEFSISSNLMYMLALAVVPLAYLSNMVHIYGFAWVYTAVGKKLGGQGTRKELEGACAWSFAPMVVLRLVLTVVAFFTVQDIPLDSMGSPEELIKMLPQMLVAGALSMVLWAYVLFVHVSLLAEAHRFSFGSGALLFVLTFILYLVVLAAMSVGGFALAVSILFITGGLAV
jgi:hypothetical protein